MGIANKRQEAMERLPKIDEKRPLEGHYSIHQIQSIKGKTVEHVEIGFRQPHEGVHQSEVIILHFTDGSILGIDTGSNAKNIADDHKDIQPSDFEVDFMLQWVLPFQD